MTEMKIETESGSENGKISLLGAIFIGIGSMVGAGIFALFGEVAVLIIAITLGVLIGTLVISPQKFVPIMVHSA